MTGATKPTAAVCPTTAVPRRDIVVGRHSKVWRSLSADPRLQAVAGNAISHLDLVDFQFGASDRVWVFSYSRAPAENANLLRRIGDAGVAEVVYISSSSCVIVEMTSCYEYPRVKRLAEQQALTLRVGKVLTIGLVYSSEDELPAGVNVATSLGELAEFMASPHWPHAEGRRKQLFRVVRRPFAKEFERGLHRVYGRAITALGRYPCLLRPVDLLLRALGMRWYGYVYLSNRRWTSTTS